MLQRGQRGGLNPGAPAHGTHTQQWQNQAQKRLTSPLRSRLQSAAQAATPGEHGSAHAEPGQAAVTEEQDGKEQKVFLGFLIFLAF